MTTGTIKKVISDIHEGGGTNISEGLRLGYEQAKQPSVPADAVRVVLLLWLTVIFASFGLFAPRNATVLAVLAVCALSVAGAVFLITELDNPFEGLLKVSAEPMRFAYDRLNL